MLRLKQQRAQKEAEAARAAEEAAKAAAAASTTGNDGDIAAPISVFGIDGVAVRSRSIGLGGCAERKDQREHDEKRARQVFTLLTARTCFIIRFTFTSYAFGRGVRRDDSTHL